LQDPDLELEVMDLNPAPDPPPDLNRIKNHKSFIISRLKIHIITLFLKSMLYKAMKTLQNLWRCKRVNIEIGSGTFCKSITIQIQNAEK
jgi:hypothetical protein